MSTLLDYPVRDSVAFSRVWSMPSSDTFTVKPISEMVRRYLANSKSSCDPFARNTRLATYTNDINPNTNAQYHLDAEEFLYTLARGRVRCDLVILDPPYSPRQISECYKEAGIPCGMTETQNAALYSRIKKAVAAILEPDAIVLSFGWNSAGMGLKYGFEIIELMLVCHGAAHNDTICLAERKRPDEQGSLL